MKTDLRRSCTKGKTSVSGEKRGVADKEGTTRLVLKGEEGQKIKNVVLLEVGAKVALRQRIIVLRQQVI